MVKVKVKRVYWPRDPDDGQWVLVERLWPRGVRRDLGDLWMKDVAPSPELRKWFSHDPSKWEEFRSRYLEELSRNPAVGELLEIARRGNVTLIYSARDEEHNGAIVLREFIEKALEE